MAMLGVIKLARLCVKRFVKGMEEFSTVFILH
jgi:hypothetical protein